MAMVKCRECGKEISDEARTCPHCGCPSEVERKMQTVRDSNSNGGKIVRVIVGIIIAIIGFILLYQGCFNIGYGG